MTEAEADGDYLVLLVAYFENHADLWRVVERPCSKVLLRHESTQWPVGTCLSPYNATPSHSSLGVSRGRYKHILAARVRR